MPAGSPAHRKVARLDGRQAFDPDADVGLVDLHDRVGSEFLQGFDERAHGGSIGFQRTCRWRRELRLLRYGRGGHHGETEHRPIHFKRRDLGAAHGQRPKLERDRDFVGGEGRRRRFDTQRPQVAMRPGQDPQAEFLPADVALDDAGKLRLQLRRHARPVEQPWHRERGGQHQHHQRGRCIGAIADNSAHNAMLGSPIGRGIGPWSNVAPVPLQVP